MIEKLKALSETGIKFPFAYDGETGFPSVTLFFAYVTFLVALVSVIAVHFRPDFLTGTISSLMFWLLSVVFYRMRKIDKLKFNAQEKSIEISDNNSDAKENDDAPKN